MIVYMLANIHMYMYLYCCVFGSKKLLQLYNDVTAHFLIVL